MKIALYLMFGLLASGAAANPYETPPKGDDAALLQRNAVFGLPGADAAMATWLAANPSAPANDRERLFHQLCADYGVKSLHALRAAACAQEGAIKRARDGASVDDDDTMSKSLRDVPPVRAIGSARVPLVWNFFGSTSADVTVNGVTAPWFMDTGAEISVLSESLANRLGVRTIDGAFQVGTSTAPVMGNLAVIDLLTIGTAQVENVPVLILPDKQLSIGGDKTIPGILGLPVFFAFRRVAWLDNNKVIALGDAAPAVNDARYRIYWHENGLGVPIATQLGVQGAHLDTGANRTDLWAPGTALLTAGQKAALVDKEVKTGGAGGIVTEHQKHVPVFEFTIAGAPTTLKNVAIMARGEDGAARVGMDALDQFESLMLDFEHMTMRVLPKPNRPADGTAQ